MLQELRPRLAFSVRAIGMLSVVLGSLSALGACAQGTTIGVGGSGGDGGGDSGRTVGPAGATTQAVSTSAGPTTSSPASTSPGATVTTGSGPTVTSSAVTTGSGMSPPGTMFFSEYIEGSSNNKALEIVNAGPTSVSLNGCEIDRYQNGSVTAAAPITLNASTLSSGQVFVICHTSFSQPALCDQLSGSIQHTGNDVVALSCNGTVMDIFGRIGEDMVWGTPPTSSMDSTLRRKCSVTVGDTNGSDAFDPATEWDGFPIDTFTDLGQYNCP